MVLLLVWYKKKKRIHLILFWGLFRFFSCKIIPYYPIYSLYIFVEHRKFKFFFVLFLGWMLQDWDSWSHCKLYEYRILKYGETLLFTEQFSMARSVKPASIANSMALCQAKISTSSLLATKGPLADMATITSPFLFQTPRTLVRVNGSIKVQLVARRRWCTPTSISWWD